MLRTIAILFAATTMLMPASAAFTQERKPRVPPGSDPGGIAIALFSTGVDYTVPEIAARLARDGEGEIIGWDLEDNDNRPFEKRGNGAPPGKGGAGTELARALVGATAGVRLVAVRINAKEPASWARAVAFVAHTPARIVAVPMWGPDKKDWEPFRQAASHFKDLLFVVAAGDDGKDLDKEPVYPAALGLPNAIVVASATAAPEADISANANWGANIVDARVPAEGAGPAVVVAAKAAAAVLSREPGLHGAELKAKLIQSAPQRREGEAPPRTRSAAIIISGDVRPPEANDPASRSSERKARVRK